jgi:hypothetical protein
MDILPNEINLNPSSCRPFFPFDRSVQNEKKIFCSATHVYVLMLFLRMKVKRKERSARTRVLVDFIWQDIHLVEKKILYEPVLGKKIFISAITGKMQNKYVVCELINKELLFYSSLNFIQCHQIYR